MVQVIKERDRNSQIAVKGFRLHLVSIPAAEITEAITLVVSAIQPHHEETAGFQIFIQRFDGGFAIWSVVEHTNAIDDVKALGGERQGEDIGLESDKVPPA